MSFIFKNNDDSQPNLVVGEILDTMLLNDCRWAETYWRSQSFPTGSQSTGSISVDKQSGEIYSFSVQYYSEDYMRAYPQYYPEGGDAWKRGVIAKEIFDVLHGTATQLYMPNLISIFPNFFVSNFREYFQGDISISASGASGRPAYQINYYKGSSSKYYANTGTGGLTTQDRMEVLKGGGIYSVGIKYWGDVERSLRAARENNAYVFFSVSPFYGDINKNRVVAGHRMRISFAENFSSYGGLFSDPSITPENVEHKNDLPDDQNTYPGGGNDSNTYPEDTPDGLNGSGNGTFDNSSDDVDFPSMPIISMWNPTLAEISSLYAFLWDSDISTTLKKLFLEPMDAIISLSLVPVDPINFAEKRHVTIGHVDTDVQMYAVQKQFVDFDFGSIKLDEYYGAAWDYSPYTKVSIYLPYIGSQEIDVDDVMNATLHLKYRVDLLSGMCVAMLKATRSRDGLDAVIYTWQGNCAMQVPITAGSAREFINTFIQIGALTGLALVQPAAGALAMKGTGDLSMSADIMAMKSNMVNPTMGTYAALNVIGQKVHVQRGGRVDANAGVMSPQSAYIIINRPVSGIPKGWNEYAGYPSLKIKTLSTQKGYTQVAYIKLNNLEATAEEISELDGLLRGGVIL